MDKLTRWTRLIEMLAGADDGRLSIEEVVQTLQVSAATVRRDFDELAAQQMLTRTRGGAVSNGQFYDLPLRYKTTRYAAEKRRIAETVARFVGPGQVVGLNGGTTTTEVARVLAGRSARLTEGAEAPLTIVTNALNIAHELAVQPKVKVVVIGGVARPQSYELIGPLATKILTSVTLDVAILGVDAVDAVGGASAHHEGEASINQLMGSRAKELYIVADGSKVGTSAFAHIVALDSVSALITDSSAPASAVSQIEAAHCRVLIV